MIAIEIFSQGVLPVDGLIHDVHNGMQDLGQVTVDTSDAPPPPRPKLQATLDIHDVNPPPRPKFELIAGAVDVPAPPRPKLTLDLQDNVPPPRPK